MHVCVFELDLQPSCTLHINVSSPESVAALQEVTGEQQTWGRGGRERHHRCRVAAALA